MSQVRSKESVRDGAVDRVTIDASRALEYPAPFDCLRTHGGILLSRLLLPLYPIIEVCARLHVDSQEHLPVLSSTVLRALSKVEARLVRIDPCAIRMIRDQICLAGEARNPKAVIGIS